MPNVFLMEQGVIVKRKENQIRIEKDERKLMAFPISYVDGIYAFGNIEIKPAAINFLLQNNKFVAFLSLKGTMNGILIREVLQSNNTNRITQLKIVLDDNIRLTFAKEIILKKLENTETVFGISLEAEKNRLKSVKSIEQLLGVEGMGSYKMFEVFKRLVNELGFNFQRRDYNPPPDEVNALLSATYMYYYNIILPEVIMNGFDPYIGVLHSKRGTHRAFVSDIMEVSRPQLTMMVYEFLKTKANELSFKEVKEGVYLSEESMRILVRSITPKLQNLIEENVKFLRSSDVLNSVRVADFTFQISQGQ
ncbi:MAG TPA: CRISPR-associated endonuclease Cas1 [Hydrogenobaculum sp.]|nr:CRISPR-associated endonuclease Cas1 [Hydrogenobaculum sp.]